MFIYKASWRYADSDKIHLLGYYDTLQESIDAANRLIVDDRGFGSSPGLLIHVQQYGPTGTAATLTSPAYDRGDK